MRVFGDRLLVERILEKKTVMDSKGEFKGKVKVLAIGDKFDKSHGVQVGDELIVSGDFLVNGESYVIDKQILRWGS